VGLFLFLVVTAVVIGLLASFAGLRIVVVATHDIRILPSSS
jgi:uncharacterized membrane protein